MIFRPELAQAILNGRKTETRRPAKFRQINEGTRNERSEWLPCRYRPGRTYSIQPGRGKKGIGRLRVTEVRRGYLHELGDEAIRAEGFASRAEFERTWADIYGRGNYLDPVYVIRFELVQSPVPLPGEGTMGVTLGGGG